MPENILVKAGVEFINSKIAVDQSRLRAISSMII